MAIHDVWISIYQLNANMTIQITTSLTALIKSKLRSRFKLTEKDRLYIHTKGIDTIRSNTIGFIKTRLAPAPAFPRNDGKQTPMRGHHVFIAQPATATCCRGVSVEMASD
jgi:hypothetical protein